jgi:hypothetical protein
MGRRWATNPGNPRGTFEARMFARHCRPWFPEPTMAPAPCASQADRITWLRRWLAGRERPPGGVLGAKHPGLCLMVPDLLQAWPHVQFLAVDRPVEESVASILGRRWSGWTPATAAETIRRLVEARDRALQDAGRASLRVAYHDVLADPAAVVSRIVQWAGTSPTPEQVAAAIASVDPMLRTVHAAALPQTLASAGRDHRRPALCVCLQ